MSFHILSFYIFIYILPSLFAPAFSANICEFDFKVFTVATNETDGFKDFIRSAKYYNIPVEVLGFGTKWTGGNMMRSGGGYKINLLNETLKPYRDCNKIIMYIDSYDVLFLSDAATIVEKFLSTNSRILFSAENWIWPDSSLAKDYPKVALGYPYLNSGGFIGYVDTVYKLFENNKNIKSTDDDQLFYTLNYLNKTLRESLKIALDHEASIFQNLHGTTGDVELVAKRNKMVLQNIKYGTTPSILHGNGLSKFVEFRSLGNYLVGKWIPNNDTMRYNDNTINLEYLSIHRYPIILIAVFINHPTPFFEEFLAKIAGQNYPKKKIHLFIHNAISYHKEEITNFVSRYKQIYRSIKIIPDSDKIDTVTARHLAMHYCLEKLCESYLNVDSEAHLDNPDTLISLIQSNKSVIAPMINKPFKVWSNFWGALDKAGYYKRSFDYLDIVQSKKKGLWNVPYVTSCYLINATVLRHEDLKPNYSFEDLDHDMAFCKDMRMKGIYLYVDNRKNFGHLTDLQNFNISRTNPDIYELLSNKWDWEKRYLHSEYHDNFNANRSHVQPCPDVYWFPIVSARFCKEFIEIMEAFGKWSDGSHNDARLQGGYEAVPTRDIHMHQVDLNDQWMEFLRLYVAPLQELVFIGYHHDPPRSLMNFVVRYKPDEQPSLRPHHDSSTYTINVALNSPSADYEGGGCKFIRYNCQVTDMKLGWMLMHPGRLTHYHEGLLVTKGIRYIMISFVDP